MTVSQVAQAIEVGGTLEEVPGRVVRFAPVATAEALAKLRVLMHETEWAWLEAVAYRMPGGVARYVGRVASQGGLGRYFRTQVVEESL